MLIDLGLFNYEDEGQVVDTLKGLASQLEDTTSLMITGYAYEKLTYSEALEVYFTEFGTDLVITWLLPFTKDSNTFKTAFDTLIIEMMNYFDCRNVEELRKEAYDRFNSDKWLRIDEITTIYTATINGKRHYYELMEVKKLPKN